MRPLTRKRLAVGCAIFAVFYALDLPVLFARNVAKTWYFFNSSEYRYDKNKIEIVDGKARLKPLLVIKDETAVHFQNGNFKENQTRFSEGHLELSPYVESESSGVIFQKPLSGNIDGLVSLWRFDEAASKNKAADASGLNILTPTKTGVTASFAPKLGNARSFDGLNDSLTVPYNDSFLLKGGFTVMAWVNTKVSSGTRTIAAQWDEFNSRRAWKLGLSGDNRLTFSLSNQGDSANVIHRGNSILLPGKWYHVAASFDPDKREVSLYVNGVLDSPAASYLGNVYNPKVEFIAGAAKALTGVTEEYWNGYMDELALLSRGITEEELRTELGNPEGLVGLWHMAETDGTIVDDSGYENNGIVNKSVDYGVSGKLGTGLGFNGIDQSVSINPQSHFDIKDELTVEFWFKPSQLFNISTMLSSTFGSKKFSVGLKKTKVRVVSEATEPSEFMSGASVTEKQWHHAAAVWNHGLFELYLNGVLDVSAVYDGNINSGVSGLNFGADRDMIDFFDGTMDEVSIYRRAKTAEEIAVDSGKNPQGGVYLSAVKDVAEVKPWKKISWKEKVPYGEALKSDEKRLIYLWHLEEKKGGLAKDEKGKSDAEIIGTRVTRGKFGSARYFENGPDAIRSVKPLPSLSQFTFEFWVSFNQPVPSENECLLQIGNRDPAIYRSPVDGRLHVFADGQPSFTGGRTLLDTAWHHIVLSSDGVNLILYVDGQRDGSDVYTGSTTKSSLSFGDDGEGHDTFTGIIDEPAIFDIPLSEVTIRSHYQRGVLDARFLVRASNDFPSDKTPWVGLEGNDIREIQPSEDVIGLWHFNELDWNEATRNISDSSSSNLQGRFFGTKTIRWAPLGEGALFNGGNDRVAVSDSPRLRFNTRKGLTLSAWVKIRQSPLENAEIIRKVFRTDPALIRSSYALQITSASRLAMQLGYEGGNTTVVSGHDGDIPKGEWVHVAGVYTGSLVELFVNGKSVKTASFSQPVIYDSGPLNLGSGLRGALDEVAIHARALSREEVFDIYSHSSPDIYFKTADGETLPVKDSRYFQYLIALTSEDPAVSPQINSVSLNSQNFDTSNPTVVNLYPQNFRTIEGFRDKRNPETLGDIRYQISYDREHWFFYDGKKWVESGENYRETNSVKEVDQAISKFAEVMTNPPGNFFFKAYFHSPTGDEQAELQQVEVDYSGVPFTVTSPNTGLEVWKSGTEQEITWLTEGKVKKVNLEFTSNGVDYQAIKRDLSNEGRYVWKVPAQASSDVFVRVLDSSDTTAFDVSDHPFKITGELKLLSPKGGEQWSVGSTQSIQWQSDGGIGPVKIEYTKDGGQSWEIIKAQAKNTGEYSWQVPDIISEQIKIKVSDSDEETVFDVSDQPLSITGTLFLESPNVGDELWAVDSAYDIIWTSGGSIQKVNLSYSVDKGKTYESIIEDLPVPARDDDGKFHFKWTVPDHVTHQRSVKVRVSEAGKPSLGDSSDKPFKIVRKYEFTAPMENEELVVDAPYNLTWNTHGTALPDNIILGYSKDNFLTKARLIAGPISNLGGYLWTVPDDISDAPVYKIRIYDADDPSDPKEVFDESPAFRIKGELKLLSPTLGSEKWFVGEDREIKWETKGTIDRVRIEYTTDNEHYTLIDDSVGNNSKEKKGHFFWKIPDTLSKEARVRVSSYRDPDGTFSTSELFFEIKGGLLLQSPSSEPEILHIGDQQKITWATVGTLPRVKIEYTTNGKDYSLIDDSKDNNTGPARGQYLWKIPNIISDTTWIRISDFTRPEEVFHVSEQPFKIVGNIRLLKPSADEKWVPGESKTIEWETLGEIPRVRIEYSFDGVAYTLIDDTANNNFGEGKGKYVWTVPDQVSRAIKIRISDYSYPLYVSDESKSGVEIWGRLKMNTPAKPDAIWPVESMQEIRWDTTGSVDRIRLEYTTDGLEYHLISDGEGNNKNPNRGVFRWNVPDLITNTLRFRVSDFSNPSVLSVSESPVKIAGQIQVSRPTRGTEVFTVGEEEIITWNTTGTVPRVRIDYTPNGSDYYLIDEAPGNNESDKRGNFIWKIPDAITRSARVRVSDFTDPNIVFDESDIPFSIQGALAVTSLKDGPEVWEVGSERVLHWDTSGTIDSVLIEYTKNDKDFILIDATPNNNSGTGHGAYSWIVPDDVTTEPVVKIRVSDALNAEVSSISLESAKISGKLTLTSPNGGEKWRVGEEHPITWSTTGTFGPLVLEYSLDGEAFVPINKTVPNQGTFLWTIPKNIIKSPIVRITYAEDPSVSDISDIAFGVNGALKLITPNGGETLMVGEILDIRWDSTDRSIQKVTLEYSTNGFVTPDKTGLIAAGDSNDGRFSWTVPDDLSKDVKVRISDSEDLIVTDLSDAPFKIRGKLELVSPSSGTEIPVATRIFPITWKTLGNISRVKLEYSMDNFGDPENTVLIDDSPENNMGGNRGRYEWQVPDKVSAVPDLKIRVSDYQDPFEVYDVSDYAFKIRADLKVTSPDEGSEIWTAGEEKVITWDTVGTINRVKIEYSPDGFNFRLIDDSVGNNSGATQGKFVWKVPDDISSIAKVKVSDFDDPVSTSDTSDRNFKIQGGFKFRLPAPGDAWVVGNEREMAWGTIGTIPRVKLEYTSDGHDFVLINDEPNNNQGVRKDKYVWRVPDTLSNKAQIRITDYSDPAVSVLSQIFKITGSFKWVSPNNGSEIFRVGTQEWILWENQGSVDRVRIEYTGNGKDYQLIDESPGNNTGENKGRFLWTIPDGISSSVKVQISDFNDPSVADTSDNYAKIRGQLKVVGPNGGENWVVGTQQEITWQSFGAMDRVKIEYTVNDQDYTLIDDFSENNMGSNQGKFLWTVPDAIAPKVKIRISDYAHESDTFDTSDDFLKIRGNLSIIRPAGEEEWLVGSEEEIHWETFGTVDRVKMEYSTDQFQTPENTFLIDETPENNAGKNKGHFFWKVPDRISRTVWIRISDFADPKGTVFVSKPFKIRGSIELSSPLEDDVWAVGETHDVTWETIGTIERVKIEYTTDGKTIVLMDDSRGNNKGEKHGRFSWKVPDAISPNVQIRVSSFDDTTLNGTSDVFKIKANLRMTKPDNGTEIWRVGDQHLIRWKTLGTVDRVKLEYSLDDANFSLINETAGNNLGENRGKFLWTVPDEISSSVKVRVSDYRDAEAFDLSDQFFKIRGQFKVVYPNGGETLVVGSKQTLKWNATGTMERVRIKYTVDGREYFLIDDSEGNNAGESRGNFNWEIPDTISDHVKIYVEDYSDPKTVFDESDLECKISGAITTVAPSGDEEWTVGSEHDIRWESKGTIPTVRIEYSTDDFHDYVRLIEESENNNSGDRAGKFVWTVPDDIHDKIKIRVSDVRDGSVDSQSQGTFKILGVLKILTPSSGREVWQIGSHRAISWATTGTVNTVRIEYSKDNFVSHSVLIDETPGNNVGDNQDHFSWTIPDDVASSVKVRVSDPRYPSLIYDLSDEPFQIIGTFRFNEPHGGESLTVGKDHELSWQTKGDIVNVLLDYSKDGFEHDINPIAGPIRNTGNYLWRVANDIGPKAVCRVRVRDANQPSAEAISKPFKIHGKLKFISPAAGESLTVGEQKEITWKTVGSIDRLRLEYTADGRNWKLIDASENNNVSNNRGRFVWQVPDDISPSVKLRLSDYNDPAVSAESGAFRVRGALRLLTPNGGDIWSVTSPAVIKWETKGTISRVKLEYSINGTDYHLIDDSEDNNSGSLEWKVPDIVSNSVILRIQDYSDPQVIDSSDEPFKVQPKFSIVSPVPHEAWTIGKTQKIKWHTDGACERVKIEYSVDDFVIAQTIADSLPVQANNLTTYRWQIPAETPISDKLKIRVLNLSDRSNRIIMEEPFTVKGDIQLISFLGGEHFEVGSEQTILWNTFGAIDRVRVEYFVENAGSGEIDYVTISDAPDNNKDGSKGKLVWKIPDQITDSMKVRVCDHKDPSVCAESDHVFKIQASLRLISPLGGESWGVGSSQSVRWENVGTVPTIRLEYSKDDFNDDIHLIDETLNNNLDDSHGRFEWIVPDDISATLKVRVLDARDTKVSSVSDNVFKVLGAFKLLVPGEKNEIWRVRTQQTIAWETTGTIDTVLLQYSGDEFQNEIIDIDATPMNNQGLKKGIFLWTVPENVGYHFKVRVADARFPDEVRSESKETFEIAADFQFVSPKGGEEWIVGSSQEILWKTVGQVANVVLEYSKDGFVKDVQPITSPLPNPGEFSWTVPDDITSTPSVSLRVKDAVQPKAYAVSKPIKIRGQFKILRPAKESVLTVGEAAEVVWETSGSIRRVKIEYTLDGLHWFLMDSSDENNEGAMNGKYIWQVPDDISDNVSLRISDFTDPGVSALSDVFRIHGALRLVTPNGGEVWNVSSPAAITWETMGTISRVKLEYSINGVDYILIDDSEDNNTGSIEWKVPDIVSDNATIRVQDYSDPQVVDSSDEPFKVQPKFSIVSPVPHEVWTIGKTQKIKWHTDGACERVKIEYSVDDFATAHIIADSLPVRANKLTTYRWMIPGETPISDKLKIRVLNLSDSSNGITMKDSFTVKGAIQLTSLLGGERFVVGSEQMIRWKTFGAIDRVKVEYFTENGEAGEVDYVGIGDDPDNNMSDSKGKMVWKIPDVITDSMHVRVCDYNDPSVCGVSDHSFKIEASFRVLSPKGGEIFGVGSSQPIRWENVGTVPTVRLEYSKDDFKEDIHLIDETLNNNLEEGHGAFEWIVPDDISAAVTIRVMDARDHGVFAASDKTLKILGAFKLLAPGEKHEIWRVGTLQTIAWETTGTIDSVLLQYSGDDFHNEIYEIDGAPLNNQGLKKGKFVWTVPENVGYQFKVRVADARFPEEVRSESKETFQIAAGFDFVSPKGGEEWTVGSSQKVLWETVGKVANIVLEYSKDEFVQDIDQIAGPIPNSGEFTWILPDDITSAASVKLRVRDAIQPEANAVSRPMKIRGRLELLKPVKESVLTVGEKAEVVWETSGSIRRVKIEYTADGLHWFLLDSTDGNNEGARNGKFIWHVPDEISDNVSLRISDFNDASVSDASKVPFKIRGALRMASPDGGEVLNVGDRLPVKWETTGSIERIKLFYSADGGEWVLVDDALGNNANDRRGELLWVVPDAVSRSVKMKVQDFGHANVEAVSSDSFEIRARLEMVSPNGQEAWQIGQEYPLTWRTFGTVPKVRIEYSADNFKTVSLVADSVISVSNDLNVFSWKIPGKFMTTDSAKIRVTDLADTNVDALSQSPFSLKGSLHVLSPAEGTAWEVGAQKEIQWETTGAVNRVRIEYSTGSTDTKGEPIYVLIDDSVDNNRGKAAGHFLWTVPDAISRNARIRISDFRYPESTFGVSEPAFTIHGGIKVLNPVGGEIWPVGSPQKITWETSGTVPQVSLQYSFDRFQKDSHPIVDSISNAGTFDWLVPDAISDELTVRVFDPAASQITVGMSKPFKVKGELHLLSPNGEETFRVGTEEEIRWETSGTIPRVRLEYSKDQFSKHIEAIDMTPGNNEGVQKGHFVWRIPDSIGNSLRVRISSFADPTVTDLSDRAFKIHGGLELIQPNGEESLKVGEPYPIRWRSSGKIERLKIEYSLNDRDYILIDDSEENNSVDRKGEFYWTVPDSAGTTVRIRIRDHRYPEVNDVSDRPFTIQPQLNLLAPNGQELWAIGGEYEIRWLSKGTVPQVRLEYSLDGFKTAQTIADQVNARSNEVNGFLWTIPEKVPATDGIQIRVASLDDTSIYDIGDAPFRVRGNLRVLNPNGGELVHVGSYYEVRWETKGPVDYVSLYYSTDDFRNVIQPAAENIVNSGTYHWKIPDVTSDSLKIKVCDAKSGASVYDISDRFFKVRGVIEVTQPNGGENWKVGTEHEISWNTIGTIERVRIEYSKDGFVNDLHLINESSGNNAGPEKGVYSWRVPQEVSGDIKVRVSDYQDPAAVSDVSDGSSRLAGEFDVLTPDGGEVLEVGTEKEILWKNTGFIPKVDLEYSADGFKDDVHSIVEGFANSGRFRWIVPDAISPEAAVRVRVRDSSQPAVEAVSDQPFKISGIISDVSLTGKQRFPVGSQQPLVWRSRGNIPQFKLEYSKDDFRTDVNFIATVPAENLGKEPNGRKSFLWSVPDDLTASAVIRLRVSDARDGSVNGVSERAYQIHGELGFIEPQRLQAITVGQPLLLEWKTNGTIRTVKLEYSKDRFTRDIRVIERELVNQGRYQWTIPNDITPSPVIFLRISDVRDGETEAITKEPFKIRGEFRVTSPNVGEEWVVGEEHLIQWQSLGTIGRVKLEYSKDDFKQDVHLIEDNVANGGVYVWNVPEARANTVKVRVSDAADAAVYDVSDRPFKVSYYTVVWNILDSVTKEHLKDLTVTDSSGWSASGLSSPVSQEYPFGTYTTTWSGKDIADGSKTWIANDHHSFTLYMEGGNSVQGETAARPQKVGLERILVPSSVLLGETMRVHAFCRGPMAPMISVHDTLNRVAVDFKPMEPTETPDLFSADIFIDQKAFEGGKSFSVIVRDAKQQKLETAVVFIEKPGIPDTFVSPSAQQPFAKSIRFFPSDILDGFRGSLVSVSEVMASLDGKVSAEDRMRTVQVLNGIVGDLSRYASSRGVDIARQLPKSIKTNASAHEIRDQADQLLKVIETLKAAGHTA